ncbi:hypothetical protein NONI108955_37970 [Nocardia ninae]
MGMIVRPLAGSVGVWGQSFVKSELMAAFDRHRYSGLLCELPVVSARHLMRQFSGGAVGGWVGVFDGAGPAGGDAALAGPGRSDG